MLPHPLEQRPVPPGIDDIEPGCHDPDGPGHVSASDFTLRPIRQAGMSGGRSARSAPDRDHAGTALVGDAQTL